MAARPSGRSGDVRSAVNPPAWAAAPSARRAERRRLTAANISSQVLLGLSVVVVTRLYDPGVFGVFVAVDAVLQVVATVPAVGLERGLARATTTGQYRRLLRTALLVSALSPVVLAIPIAVNVGQSTEVTGGDLVALVLLGFAVASARGVVFVLRYHSVVSDQLAAVIRLELVGAALLLMARSGLGLLLGTAQALLMAAAIGGIGTIVAVRPILHCTPRIVSSPDHSTRPGERDPNRRESARQAARAMAVEGPIAVLQRVPTHGLPILAGLVLGTEAAAVLAIAGLLTFRPVSVIARATADLTLASLASRKRDERALSGTDTIESVRATGLMSVALLTAIATVATFGAAPVLGESWRYVGTLTWALLPLNVATIVAIPVHHALTVADRGALRLAAAAAMATVVGTSIGLVGPTAIGLPLAVAGAGFLCLGIVGALTATVARTGPNGTVR